MSQESFIQWLANGERGLSSNAIATKLSGLDCMLYEPHGWTLLPHPSDPDDFQRCMKLLNQVPEFRERLYEMKDVSEVWSHLVDNWDGFERLYYEECETVRCPKLWDRMKEIGC